jgi:spore coat protein CotH
MSHIYDKLFTRSAPWFALLLSVQGCGNSSSSNNPGNSGGTGSTSTGTGLCSDDVQTRPVEWTVESHCPGVAPNYDEVFDASVVRRIDLEMTADNFTAMETDLKKIKLQASGDLDGLATPMWVPVTVTYNSKVWTQVGMRWKGHASLTGALSANIDKLSFALDFDNQEDNFEELLNQQFYGFKKLNFANGYKDASLIRDKTAGDIFRAAGVPAPRTSFAAIYLNTGSGPVYYGLYTIIEDPADEMLNVQLGDGSGNLYKPWGEAAKWLSLADVPQADVQTYFEKETNEDTSDWSDVIAALTALHADRTDATGWRTNLEKVFDVPSFLRVLAVNQIIMNWDSYGCMHHNYLVYGDPKDNNRLKWMPWDLNEALSDRTSGPCPPPGSILLDEIVSPPQGSAVDTNWPLIKFILGDATYRSAYLATVKDVMDNVFIVDQLKAKMQLDHELIAPYVVGPTATEAFPLSNTTTEKFNASLTGTDASGATVTSVSDPLFPHIEARRTAVRAVLTENGL